MKCFDKIKERLFREGGLVRDNADLFIGNFILGVCGYLYHFFIGRVLGPAEYGALGALFAIIYFFVVVINVIQTSITKFVSQLRSRGQYEKLSYLYFRSLRRLAVYGVAAMVVFDLLSLWIKDFLRIEDIGPFLILGAIIVFSTILPVCRGVMQGLQRFRKLSMNLVVEGIAKLILSVVLVYFGFGLGGALFGLLAGIIAAFLLAFYGLRELWSYEWESFETKQVYAYSFPVLMTLLGLTFMFTIDVFLVKHFFDAASAGYYAAVSLLGKILFFGSITISMVMFPKVVELNIDKKPSKFLLHKSILLVLAFCVPVTLFYLLFPNFTVNLLYGGAYLSVANLVWVYALFMTIFCVVYLLGFYNLSVGNFKFIYLILFFDVVELVMILLFHDNLAQIIYNLLIMVSVLFLTAVTYTEVTNG